MAKIVSEKQINSFVKGLITEASPLTYPENASLDEENFDLELNGSRKRRLGLDYETLYALTDTSLSTALLSSTKQSIHEWSFTGVSKVLVIGVVRIYNRLYFMDLTTANPSANLLNSGSYITINGMENFDIDVTVLNGNLVIAATDLARPVILTYNELTDTVSQSVITLLIRDLFGVDDGFSYDARPTTLSNAHQYNLTNQGWSETVATVASVPAAATTGANAWGGDDRRWVAPVYTGTNEAIDYCFTINGWYPSNSDIWTYGKSGDPTDAGFEVFDPALLEKNSVGNSQAPKGSFIIDAFSRGSVRSAVSAINGLPLDKEVGAISTIEAYAGRVFYSGIYSSVTGGDSFSPNYSGYIFFSQTSTDKDKMGKCYQEADPTSPNISDLVATDGGVIHIPEAAHITKLITTRSSLVVFAENGIWEIFGDTEGFTATKYQVSKISSVGVAYPNAIVEANGNIVYWAKTGIHVLTTEESSGRLLSQNISLTTIQSFYDTIPETAKANARGFFDEPTNHVRWLYNDEAGYGSQNYINKYNKELNFDMTLTAFYKYSFSDLASNSPYVAGYIRIPNFSLSNVESDVYVGTDPVIVTDLSSVVTNDLATTSRTSNFNYLMMDGSNFTIGKLSNTSFMDWYTKDSTGITYSSYLITGYEMSGDMMKKKQVPYILFYFSRTEDGYTQVGGDLVLDNQSGCQVQAQWNWTDSANSGKWGTAFQAYRLGRNYTPTGAEDTFDYGYEVIVTKSKLRGSGRVLSLKISSDDGKDMQLLGWANEVTGNSKA